MGELSKRAFLVGASGSAVAAMLPAGGVVPRKYIGSYMQIPIYEVAELLPPQCSTEMMAMLEFARQSFAEVTGIAQCHLR